MIKAGPHRSGLCFAAAASDCPSAANEVHDDRYQRKEKEEMNQETADVQDEKSAKPKQNQHHSQNEEHS
jgi:hypothetical protein